MDRSQESCIVQQSIRLLLFCLGLVAVVPAPAVSHAGDDPATILLVLDASGSIAAKTATGSMAEAPASGDGRVWLDKPDPVVVTPGAKLVAHFEAAPTFHANAWIGIVPAGIPHGSEQQNDAHDLSYVYLRKQTRGSVTLTVPAQLGAYDVRLNDSDSNGREVSSASFEVRAGQGRVWLDKTTVVPGEQITIHYSAAAQLPATAWIGIVPSHVEHGSEQINDANDVGYRYVSETSEGTVTLSAPTKAGSWDARLNDLDNNGSELASVSFTVVEASAQVHLERTRYAPGDTVIVHFTVPAGLPNNAWAGIVPSEVPHGSESTNDDNDLAYRYLGGKSTGELEFSAPATPGSYDIRVNDTDSSGNEIASATFVVE